MRRSRISVFLMVSFLLSVATPAFASMTEYYTYGGFDPVTVAFNNVASIWGDHSFAGGSYTFALVGILFAVLGTVTGLFTGRMNPTSWVIGIFPGIILYTALFVPKTTLYVYDTVYNQNTAIGGLPVGVVYAASFVNHIERFVVTVFDNNAPIPPKPATACGGFTLTPMNYADNGGAVGPRIQQIALGQFVLDTNASSTMTNYVNDCVSFELVRPGTMLTMQWLLNPPCGQSILDVLSYAGNPANFTTTFIPTADVPSPGVTGSPDSCDYTYAALQTFYTNPDNTSAALGSACGSAGFGSDASSTGRCQQLLSDQISNSVGASGLTPSAFVSNNTIASITQQVLASGSISSILQYQTMSQQASSGISGGMSAGLTNPYTIDAYVAYSIMLFPLLAMLIPTPMWRKVLELIMSLIFWTTLLRSLDVITFHLWSTYYLKTLATALSNSGMGIEAAMKLPSLDGTYLGYFASLRTSVFLLATIISGALFKFGDSALSRLAADAKNQGGASGHTAEKVAMDPGLAAAESRAVGKNASDASFLHSMATSPAMANIGRGMAANEYSSAGRGEGRLEAAGAGGVNSMMSSERHAQKTGSSEEWGSSGSKTGAQAAQDGRIKGGINAGTREGLGPKPENAARDNAAFKAADTTATVQQTAAGLGEGVIAAGTDSGKYEGANKAGGAEGGKTAGYEHVQSAAEAAATDHVAKDKEERALADQMVDTVAPGLKDQPGMSDGHGHLSNTGFMEMQQSMHGSGKSFGTEDGKVTVNAGSDGKIGSMQATGTVMAGDKKRIGQIRSQIKKGNFGEGKGGNSALAEFDKIAAEGKGFSYMMETDRSGTATAFGISRGGSVDRKNTSSLITGSEKEHHVKDNQNYEHMYRSTSGSDVQHVDKNDTAFSRMSTSSVGTKKWSGTDIQHDDKNDHTRSRMNLDSEGHKVWSGDTSTHDTSHQEIGGYHVDTVEKDGTAVRGVGVVNPHTKQFQQTDGTRSQVITEKKVENTGGGEAVVTRQGDKFEHTVAVAADGSKHVDMTQEYKFGNAGSVNVGNVNASVSDKDWEKGQALDTGDASKTMAIAGRAVSVAASKVGEGLAIAGAAPRGAEIAGGYGIPNPNIIGGNTGSSLGKNGQQMKEWREYFQRSGEVKE